MGQLARAKPWRHREGALPLLAASVVLVMVAVLAAGAGLAIRVTDSIAVLRGMTDDAAAVTDSAQALQLALQDAEIAVGGLLLTGRPAFLDAYKQGADGVDANLALLAKQSLQQPWLPAELAALAQPVNAKLAELARTLDAVRTGGTEAGRAVEQSSDAVASTAVIRSAIGRLSQRAQQEQDQRSAAVQARERVVLSVVLSLAVGGVLLLGTAALGLLGGRGRLLQAQAATRAQGARWQATVEALPEGVAVFDAADTLLLWNSTLVPVTAFPPGLAAPGTPFAAFAAAAAAWQPAVLAGAIRPDHEVVEVACGERMLSVGRSAMPGGGQMLVVGDATRRVQTEAIARQAQKMEVLGQLTGGVAHDFNNLLQAISANLELMSRRVSGDSWLHGRLDAALAGVARGARLTRHLLAFARRQPLAPVAVDTALLMAGLGDLLHRTVGQGVTLAVTVDGGVWPLRADAAQLENAILNLAINARDAMSPMGPVSPALCRLTVTAGNADLTAPGAAAAAGVAPGEYVAITVADTGCGMTAKQMARAVEPFYTTKPEGQGTGLGLPMVYGFAQQSGGHLQLSSTVGVGTEVRLFIPRAHAAAEPAAAPPPTPPRGRGELVLVVEDEPELRATALLSLQDMGYAVAEAASPDAAWRLLQDGLQPRVLFSDLMMPGTLTARDLAHQARTLLPGLAVLFTSGYSEEALADATSGTAPVLTPLLAKPWRLDELARALRTALDTPPPARALRILLVEDDVLVRTVTADMLEEYGHEVVQAGNAADALRLLTGVDVLVTDVGLGGTDGLSLARTARDRIPGLPVIIASGGSRVAGAHPGLVWLGKPFTGTAVAAALAEAVGTGAVRTAVAGPAAAG